MATTTFCFTVPVNDANLEPAPLHHDEDGDYFILPAHSYGLGVALERLKIPDNITCI